MEKRGTFFARSSFLMAHKFQSLGMCRAQDKTTRSTRFVDMQRASVFLRWSDPNHHYPKIFAETKTTSVDLTLNVVDGRETFQP